MHPTCMRTAVESAGKFAALKHSELQTVLGETLAFQPRQERVVGLRFLLNLAGERIAQSHNPEAQQRAAQGRAARGPPRHGQRCLMHTPAGGRTPLLLVAAMLVLLLMLLLVLLPLRLRRPAFRVALGVARRSRRRNRRRRRHCLRRRRRRRRSRLLGLARRAGRALRPLPLRRRPLLRDFLLQGSGALVVFVVLVISSARRMRGYLHAVLGAQTLGLSLVALACEMRGGEREGRRGEERRERTVSSASPRNAPIRPTRAPHAADPGAPTRPGPPSSSHPSASCPPPSAYPGSPS